MKINLYSLLVPAVLLTGCMTTNISSTNGISPLSTDSTISIRETMPGSNSSSAVTGSSINAFGNQFAAYHWEIENAALSGVHTLVLSDSDNNSIVEIDFYSQPGGNFPPEQTYTVLSLDEANDLYNAIVYDGEGWSLIEGRAGVTLYADRDKTLFTTAGTIRFSSKGIEINDLGFKEYDSNGYIEGTERVYSAFFDFTGMEEISDLSIS
ncbi:MAG: hypothetical protein PQJ50_01590 [Spirochaetales bacterium]|nr:hypothetical protein [Spirochaetales bacterium]